MSLKHKTIAAIRKLEREAEKETALAQVEHDKTALAPVAYYDKENLLKLFELADLIREHPTCTFHEILEIYELG